MANTNPTRAALAARFQSFLFCARNPVGCPVGPCAPFVGPTALAFATDPIWYDLPLGSGPVGYVDGRYEAPARPAWHAYKARQAYERATARPPGL